MKLRENTKALFGAFWCLALRPVESFHVFVQKKSALRPMTLQLNSNEDDAQEAAQNEQTGLPMLPHFGSSSQSMFDPFDGTLPHLTPQEKEEESLKQYVANRKFELQYTCNVCDTRNCHKVSRIAYRKGVVIATCKGCGSRHLIADNLGYTKLWDSEEEGGNIEEYFANKGMEDNVNRVSKDVFDLERVLGYDSDSGSIVGEDGKPAME